MIPSYTAYLAHKDHSLHELISSVDPSFVTAVALRVTLLTFITFRVYDDTFRVVSHLALEV